MKIKFILTLKFPAVDMHKHVFKTMNMDFNVHVLITLMHNVPFLELLIMKNK